MFLMAVVIMVAARSVHVLVPVVMSMIMATTRSMHVPPPSLEHILSQELEADQVFGNHPRERLQGVGWGGSAQ